MPQRDYIPLVAGNEVLADTLNDNFDRLADTIDPVRSTQIVRNAVVWDAVGHATDGASAPGNTDLNPVLASIRNSGASLAPGTRVLAASIAPTVVTDGTNDFLLSFIPAIADPAYVFEDGDFIKYWFMAECIVYDPTGAVLATNDCVWFYPQFNTTTVPFWNSAWPAGSGNRLSPGWRVGPAVDGNAIINGTVRTGAVTGYGPGAYRHIILEGLFPVRATDDRLDVRIVYQTLGTNAATLQAEIQSAYFQGCLFKKGMI